jgi:hypothetical protein
MISRAPSFASSESDSPGVLADPDGEQLVDLGFYLRRREGFGGPPTHIALLATPPAEMTGSARRLTRYQTVRCELEPSPSARRPPGEGRVGLSARDACHALAPLPRFGFRQTARRARCHSRGFCLVLRV